ncbi:MAG: Calx-beta domain-containing protein [Isosphaeraceae bacterium]|nr:Calx-beta domain-containing protein [Isosphaeraceae bacterium]
MKRPDVVGRSALARRRTPRGGHRFVPGRIEGLETRITPVVAPGFSSLPGAPHTIYLDFDGHVTTGTSWNSYDFDGDGNTTEHSTITSPAYDRDGNPSAFSASELAEIEDAWKRVSEDYAPFHVNVTTVDPGIEALRKSGTGDTQWGIRVVVTRDTEGSGAGGIAYINSFNWSSDTPAWVYTTGGKNVAEAASHEAGHSLGLAHDGLTTGASYYQGHGTGDTGWAPIMGVGYYKNVTTWDRGEYYNANNGGTSANYGKGPDDVAIIVGYNGFGFRADDHGDSIAAASPLGATGTALSGSGLISTRTDVDVFAFTAGAGALSLTVTPFTPGPNLDVDAKLYDASGTLIASASPTTTLGLTLTANLAGGVYYVALDGTGVGTPTVNPPTGYTDYASLGRYTITGSRVEPGVAGSLSVGDVVVNETAGTATFTVTLTGAISAPATVAYATANGSATAGADYSAVAGTLTFNAPGSQTVTVPILDDSLVETDETFELRLSGASGALIADGTGVGTIVSDDAPAVLSVAALVSSKLEGTGTTSTPFTFRVSRTGSTLAAATVSFAVSAGTGRSWAATSDFIGNAFPTGTATIPAGALSVDVNVLVSADSSRESNEQFRFTISNPPAGTSLGTSLAVMTITNDDSRNSSSAPGQAPSHEELEGAGLIPCAYPLPEDVDRWLAEHDHHHDDDHGHDDHDDGDHGRSAAIRTGGDLLPIVPVAPGEATLAPIEQLFRPLDARRKASKSTR